MYGVHLQDVRIFAELFPFHAFLSLLHLSQNQSIIFTSIKRRQNLWGTNALLKSKKIQIISFLYLKLKKNRHIQELQLIPNHSPIEREGLKAAATVKKMTQTFD